MAAFNLTNFDAALKTIWPQSELIRIFHGNYPLLTKMPKATNFKGANLVLALRYGTTQGVSTSFSEAQANKTGVPMAKFTVTRGKHYSLFSVDGETMAAAEKPESLADVLSEAVMAAMDGIKRREARYVYGNGGGSVGRISSAAVAGLTELTLTNADDIVNFEEGMWVQFASTDGTSGSVKAGKAQISAIERENGKISCAVAFDTLVGTIALSDYVFPAGDFGAGPKGLDAWLRPTGSTTPAALFGVTRTADYVRLAGNYFDGSSYGIEDALIAGSRLVTRHGGKVTDCFMNDTDFQKLIFSLGTRIELSRDDEQKWGIRGVTISGVGGSFKVYADPYCPQGRAYLLQMDTWKCRSAGPFPGFLNWDGSGKILRETSTDAYEGRIGGYRQFTCEAPAWNCVVLLSS
jgi:hypothetical protein